MTDNRNNGGGEFSIGRRTALKIAGLTGIPPAIAGNALGSPGGRGRGRGRGRGNGNDEESPIEPERVEPDRTPPWVEVEGGFDAVAKDLWFVAFAEPPTVQGGRPPEHANERAQLQNEAQREEVEFAQVRDFTTLWNGLSVECDDANVAALRGLDGVEAVYPVALVEPAEPPEPTMEFALAMTGADAAQDIGLSGEGLSVGVIDTGIDYNHPDLGGDGDTEVVYTAESADDRTLTDADDEEHPRVSHGWDYVGEGFDAGDPATFPPDPNPDPMDPHGHGTHVSGIVGAEEDVDDEGITGVAPEVTLGAYKVFDVGSTTADIIVAALEDAFEDGMDIINMSLGASLQWGQDYPTTAASNALSDAGVVVVNSAGNDAALGMWSLSAPANAHDIISVASADNLFMEALVFEVDQLEDPVPYLELAGAELPPTEGESEPLALPAESEIEGEVGYFGCEADDFDDFPEGHVALIERGHCTFAQKYLHAVAAGATGVLIYNNEPGLFSGTILDAGVEGVWGAGTSAEAGAEIVALLEGDEEVTLEFTDETTAVENPTGGLLSGFSSYGQDVELQFGPSITAPGGFITSTIPLALGEYGVSSGTSMSAPHVAGAVALLLEEEPDLDPFEVRDRLQNTAEPGLWSLVPVPGFVDHSFRQGAGMLQISDAVETDQHVSPGQISLEDVDSAEVTLTISNEGEEDVEYEVGHVGTLGASVTTFAPVFLLPGSVVTAPADVTVPAGESIELDVNITAPGFGLPNHQYGGYIVLTPDEEGASRLRVPYTGYDGDYQALDLFGYFIWPVGEPLQFIEQEPFLSEIVGVDEDGFIITEPVDPGHEFTIREGDLPVIEAFFGHFPQRMEVYATQQPSGREWLVMSADNVPRSPAPDFFFALPWAGTTQAGRSHNTRPVPSGTYTLRVEVLRTLGDPEDSNHWDVWESPEFEVDTARGGRPAAVGQTAPGDD